MTPLLKSPTIGNLLLIFPRTLPMFGREEPGGHPPVDPLFVFVPNVRHVAYIAVLGCELEGFSDVFQPFHNP